MEKEPEKGRCDARFLGNRLLQDGDYNLISLRACGPVEMWRKAWLWTVLNWMGTLTLMVSREVGKRG